MHICIKQTHQRLRTSLQRAGPASAKSQQKLYKRRHTLILRCAPQSVVKGRYELGQGQPLGGLPFLPLAVQAAAGPSACPAATVHVRNLD